MKCINKNNFILVMTLLICSIVIYLSNKYICQAKVESCKSNISLISSEFKINSIVFFYFFNQTGIVEWHGVYTSSNGVTYKINRQITFNLIKINSKYIISSTQIINRGDIFVLTTSERTLIPDLFTQEDAILALEKKESRSGERIFLLSGFPFLYCFRN